MNNTLKLVLIAVPLTLYMTGCVIVAGDDDHNDWNSSNSKESNWKKEQRINNDNIADLKLGQSLEKVRAIMGTPRFNEAFKTDDESVQVLFYRTQHLHSDGETTKDECTPLIFKDGVLVGFGSKAYNRL